jgi:hypothetical protein
MIVADAELIEIGNSNLDTPVSVQTMALFQAGEYLRSVASMRGIFIQNAEPIRPRSTGVFANLVIADIEWASIHRRAAPILDLARAGPLASLA